jgi:UDP-N-acetylglucosamine transferase subunit ALG13
MDQYSILITAGTLKLPFTRLFDLVEELSNTNSFNKIIVQGIGAANFFKGHSKIEAHDFIEKKQLDLAITNTDILISHAGVGSIVNALSLAKPTVLVPRKAQYNEHFDDHQMQIFQKMQEHPLFLCIDSQPLDLQQVLNFIQSSKTIQSIPSKGLVNQSLQQDIQTFFNS